MSGLPTSTGRPVLAMQRAMGYTRRGRSMGGRAHGWCAAVTYLAAFQQRWFSGSRKKRAPPGGGGGRVSARDGRRDEIAARKSLRARSRAAPPSQPPNVPNTTTAAITSGRGRRRPSSRRATRCVPATQPGDPHPATRACPRQLARSRRCAAASYPDTAAIGDGRPTRNGSIRRGAFRRAKCGEKAEIRRSQRAIGRSSPI